MTFVAYVKGVTGHPPDKDVTLKLRSIEDKEVQVFTQLFGGQGTNKVP